LQMGNKDWCILALSKVVNCFSRHRPLSAHQS
jgi:hypothetical protein